MQLVGNAIHLQCNPTGAVVGLTDVVVGLTGKPVSGRRYGVLVLPRYWPIFAPGVGYSVCKANLGDAVARPQRVAT